MELEFQYNTIITTINSNKDSKMIDACQQFCTKEKTSLNKVSFLYSGIILKNELELTIQNAANNNDNERNKTYISQKENKNESNTQLAYSKEIICPKCGESAKIDITEYKTIIKCINGHNTGNIFLKDFKETQKLDLSKIICDECKINNKANSDDNQFYRCNKI